MRNTEFLRTPIRVDHQGRMQNLQITEQALTGNPNANDPYPQTFQITFNTTEPEVQIALLWEGLLYFVPDDPTGYPSIPEQATWANLSTLNLVGDLMLVSTDFSLAGAFKEHIPLIKNVPSLVRYSKVKLTQGFLFTTLQEVRFPVRVISNGALVELHPDTDDSWHEKYLCSFLQGKAGVWCPIDHTDPSSDFTNMSMPSVAFTSGEPSTFNVSVSSRSKEVNDLSWFQRKGDYDDISGETLVEASLENNWHNQWFNPKHPGHSVIPLGAIYHFAQREAFVNEHWDSTLYNHILIFSQSQEPKEYRRIDIIRPPSPGTPVSAYTQRPYPQYQINWKKTGDAETQSLRLPLNGHIYVQLEDGQYDFWAIPRSRDPNLTTTGNEFRLSLKDPSLHYIDLPATSITTNFTSNENEKIIYAHLFEYDSKKIWNAFKDLGYKYKDYKRESENRWNVKVLNWYIYRSSDMEDYASIYGHIYASAGRYHLAPEFLHSVFMGEGVGGEGGLIERNMQSDPRVSYNPGQIITGWSDLGLDGIWDTVLTMANDNYINGTEFNRSDLTGLIEFESPEDGSTVRTSNVKGWKEAIEFVAAELQSRLDYMLNNMGISYSEATELERRFLAYVRFNGSIENSIRIANDLEGQLKKWIGERPVSATDSRFTGMERIRYNSLQRIAVTEWYENSRVYR